jgi:predicted metal-dependent hydrolase
MTTSQPQPQPSPLQYGIELFNTKQFYHCHDVLEAAWKEEHGPAKQFYQGLIQLAVALHHLVRQGYNGASPLLAEGIQKLEPFSPTYLGVNVGKLVAEARRCQQRVAELGPQHLADFELYLIPLIETGVP